MMYMGVTRRSLLASYISCMTRFRKQRWNSNFYSNHYCGRCCIRSFLFRYGIMLRWWRHKKQGSDSQLTKRSRGSHTTVMDTFIFYHFRGNPKSISTFRVGIHNIWQSPQKVSKLFKIATADSYVEYETFLSDFQTLCLRVKFMIFKLLTLREFWRRIRARLWVALKCHRVSHHYEQAQQFVVVPHQVKVVHWQTHHPIDWLHHDLQSKKW